MDTDLNASLPKEGTPSEGVVSRFPLFPLLSLSSPTPTSSSLSPLSDPQGEDGTKSNTLKKRYRIKEEPKDEGYEGLLLDPILPPAELKISDGKRKRVTAAAPVVKIPDTKRRKRASKPIASTNIESFTEIATKEKPSHKIKNEPDGDDSDDCQQGKMSVKRAPTVWTKEELDLVYELCRQNKTSKQILLDLQTKLNSTKTRNLVRNCRSKVKMSQVEWSPEDVGHLLQAAKNFDKYKAITYEFNKLSKRGEGEALGKGVIEFKLKSLEMEKKKIPKKMSPVTKGI